MDRIVFLVSKEEEFVFPDGAANLTAEPVVVKTWIDDVWTGLGAGVLGVNRVEVAVLEVLIHATMPFISAAHNGLVELTAGGVTKFR